MDYRSFDAVINPTIFKPVVQFTYNLLVNYDRNSTKVNKDKKQFKSTKKESKEDRDNEGGGQMDAKRQISIAEDFFKTLYGIYAGDFKNKFINEDFTIITFI